MKKLLKILFLPLALIFIGISFTGAYFTDSVTISGNTFGSKVPGPEPGDIVINEVMWMGSKGSGPGDGWTDQWIEIKNVTTRDLHKQGMYITAKNNSGIEVKIFTITNATVIKSGEFYLMTVYKKGDSALSNTVNIGAGGTGISNFDYANMQLKLWYPDPAGGPDKLIDTAGDGINPPSEGDATDFYSMQRNDNPLDGTNYANWNTCTANTSSYWDSGRTEKGTPGDPNV